MKIVTLLLVFILFAGGLVGGYMFMNRGATDDAAPAPEELTIIESTNPEHGARVVIPENAKLCSVHKVPEVICPFHKPELVEKLGWCGGHDVAEALCTRCNPTLIAAFKAEGDWCGAHGLPESQCLICNPVADKG